MATPRTGRPRGRPSTLFDKDKDRFTLGRALAFSEALSVWADESRAFTWAALTSIAGRRIVEQQGDRILYSVNQLYFPGAETSVRVLTRRLQRKWAAWQKSPEHRQRIEAIKRIVLLQLLPYSGTEEDRQLEILNIGFEAGEKEYALFEVLVRMGAFDDRINAWNDALEEKHARLR
jgi:hypothetical protein